MGKGFRTGLALSAALLILATPLSVVEGDPGTPFACFGMLIGHSPWREIHWDGLNCYSHFWEKASQWSNFPADPKFSTFWIGDRISFDGSRMRIQLNDQEVPPSEHPEVRYSSGEYRTKELLGYGTYEVSMQAAEGCGLVTSFFILFQDGDREWHEIDFEVLGRNTSKVHTNYIVRTNGGAKKSHPVDHDLGFDASEAMHTYTLVWKEDSITWYVDGRFVRKEVEDLSTPEKEIPSKPGQVMMSLWAGCNDCVGCTEHWPACGVGDHPPICAFGNSASAYFDDLFIVQQRNWWYETPSNL